jgi:hypothetical protein
MNCMICQSDSSHYFSKTYTDPPFDGYMREVGEVHYYRCSHCGFVLSKTHRDLSEAAWQQLNQRFHHFLEDPQSEQKNNQPPYAEQALMVSMLVRSGVVASESMLDYAAGYGTLSRLLSKHFGLHLPIYDPYVRSEGSSLHLETSDLGRYGAVINSAMFEHVREREDLDRVHRLVANDGCLIVHTVVCERVPPDPDWFYLVPPVHTAFHTNKSMDLLMGQWGFRSSIYCPQAKSWVLLRDDVGSVEDRVAALNGELQTTWFHRQAGFVDYWKGF